VNAADTLPALLASLHNVLKVTAKAGEEENKSDAKVHQINDMRWIVLGISNYLASL
jgi:hypothetical protein